jgi:phosphomannomutase
MANRSHELEQDKEVRVLLAFEEAIGFMCGSNVLDKDGVSALVRTMELIAFLNKRKMTLAEKLRNLYDVYVEPF